MDKLLLDLFEAYYDARRNKRNTHSQLKFELDVEHNLIELYDEIRERRYLPHPCTCFIIEDPVKREVFASDFRDRVVHHLYYNYVSPMFERMFIYDSYSVLLFNDFRIASASCFISNRFTAYAPTNLIYY